MEIEWKSVERILIIRLRSIGDTILSTPTLKTLREFLPNTKIDILLEDWVAPVLDGSTFIDEVVTVGRTLSDRISVAKKIRKNSYDVVVNLHGGTTSGFITRFSAAPFRIGYEDYQYSFLYNNRYPSSAEFWNRERTHSAEQQIALIGYAGVPFKECPKTRLEVTENGKREVNKRLALFGIEGRIRKFALIHPAAAYDTKRWSEASFARIIDYFEERGIASVVVITESETHIVEAIESARGKSVNSVAGLTLPQVTALAAKAKIFVGNDSGIAHMAAAVETPSVVIFGSSDINHWRPWTDAPNEAVTYPLDCQPCPGDKCRVYGEPKCIIEVTSEQVIAAADRILEI